MIKKNKTILITGASKGIGKITAQFLLSKGYNIIGTCRNPSDLNDKIEGVKYIPLNLSCKESINQCVKDAGDIDVLINNAGYSQLGAMEDTSLEIYRELFEVCFFGTINLTQQFLPQMRKRREGLIIFIGSLAATFPMPYYSNYCSVKAAIKSTSYSLKAEMKPLGVKVCLIEPSDLKTTIEPIFVCNENSEYKINANNVKMSVKNKMKKATDPIVIARLIDKIIISKKIKARYVVGGNGPILSFCKRFVTDSLVEKTVYRMYNIQ